MPNCLTLKKSNCKNCYKCIRHCPVKSIRFSGNQAHIIGNECILCGQCFVVCPQNAKEIVDEREKVKVLLNSGAPVIVSLAPSFAANYDGVGIDSMRVALKKLGFAGVEETALGATMVKREYERMLKEEQRDILISSCCHSINLLIQKYYPEALEYLADVQSPMQAHCSDIKRRMPQAKTVFIGPCVAKKDEAEHYEGIVDAVMTFEELTKWLDEEQITLEQKRDSDQDTRARFFPTTGGILKTMEQDAPGYTYLAIDGVENCIAALKDIENGKLHHCFVEMSACVGSCVGGPVMEKYHRTPVKDYMAIATYAGKRDFDVEQPEKGELQKHMEPIVQKSIKPSETEIMGILRQMGKMKPSDELNCGSCGYPSCRAKAIAVYQGKAELSMCLPHMFQIAQSTSNVVLDNSPNIILVADENLKITELNAAGQHVFGISRPDALNKYLYELFDPRDFEFVLESYETIIGKPLTIDEYNLTVEQTLVYLPNQHGVMGILRDVSAEKEQQESLYQLRVDTMNMAQKVIDKQMIAAQEIASLLGETTAETKATLTHLKNMIINNGDGRV